MFWVIKGTLVILYMSFQASAIPTYIGFVPKFLIPGFEVAYTIYVFTPNKDWLEITSSLRTKTSFLELNTIIRLRSGSSERIVLGTMPLGYYNDTSFEMEVICRDAFTQQVEFHNFTTDFVFIPKPLSIFIQTDKAIYQPGQIIKFRAVCLDTDLLPLNGNAAYIIEDPKHNVVVQETDLPLMHGVTGGEFFLSKDAVVGEWKVIYTVQGFTEVLSLTVELYKLPKFNVLIEVPRIIDTTVEEISIKLTSSYTYGKPVSGSADLLIYGDYYVRSYYEHDEDRRNYYNNEEIRISNKAFNGSWEVDVSAEQLYMIWNQSVDTTVAVIGTITEQLTKISFSSTNLISAKLHSIKIETLSTPGVIKPGLDYVAYVKVTKQDGKMLTETERNNTNLILEVIRNYPKGQIFPEDTTRPPPTFSPSQSDFKVYTIPPDGVVTVKLDVESDQFESVTFKPFTNFSSVQNPWTAYRAQSPSNTYVQVSTRSKTAVPGDHVNVTVASPQSLRVFHVVLLARGKVLEQHLFNSEEKAERQFFEFIVKNSMVPKVFVVVTILKIDGEVVSDYIDISVSLSLEQKISLSVSSTLVDAGTPITIKVNTTTAGAYVGIRAIDQSVLLLKSGNDISKSRVVDDLNRYSPTEGVDYKQRFSLFPTFSGAKDAHAVYDQAGMIVLTDGFIYQGRKQVEILSYDDEEYYNYAYKNFEAIELQSADYGDINSSLGSNQRVDINVRTFFPETWLWLDLISRDDGMLTYQTVAPDTITSWILSAFSVSDEHGLGIADVSKITVFRDFFVSLNLPVKVTRGEIIIVQAVVFNYFQTEEYVRLELLESDKFDLLIPGNDAEVAGHTRKFIVQAESAFSVSYPISMKSLGDVSITVTAQSEHTADAVRRTVYVRPEGIQQCYSAARFLSRRTSDELSIVEDLEIKIPDGIVKDTAKVFVYVYGDILGNTISNLGRLLRAPDGCGEQNLIKFAPDVFVTRYLHRAGKLDAETRKTAFKHFHDGYSLELKYKHFDGSYSAFGELDDSGSTWLTAFVAKCFIFARELRPDLVERRIIDEALNFIIMQLQLDGSFKEPGQVSHRDLQGGVTGPITLTAFVLITLNETKYPESIQGVGKAISEARTYLERNSARVTNNPYALSLVAYAMRVSGSPQADYMLRLLEDHATTSGDVRYWHVPSTSSSTVSPKWSRPYGNPASNDIEMTAYALLNYVAKNDLNSAVPVVKWLSSKQNDLGGYSSTQDTAIAIQALSEFAYLASSRQQNLEVSIRHTTNSSLDDEFTIDEKNSRVFNAIELPAKDAFLKIRVGGVGVGVVQLSVCYNIPVGPYEKEPFKCHEDIYSHDVRHAAIHLCCRLKSGDTNVTGMFLMEVGLPNGFTVDLEEERRRNRRAELVELGDTSVNYYFNQLNPDQDLCANVKLDRSAEVAASKSAVLKVSEYYKPDRTVTRLYSVSRLQNAGVCQVCGTDCVGCTDGALPSLHYTEHIYLLSFISFIFSSFFGYI